MSLEPRQGEPWDPAKVALREGAWSNRAAAIKLSEGIRETEPQWTPGPGWKD